MQLLTVETHPNTKAMVNRLAPIPRQPAIVHFTGSGCVNAGRVVNYLESHAG